MPGRFGKRRKRNTDFAVMGALGTASPNGRIAPPASVRSPFLWSTALAGGFVRSDKMSVAEQEVTT